MKSDTMNVPQPDRKSAARKVLLAVWLVLCTAFFICLLINAILLLRYYVEQYNYCRDMVSYILSGQEEILNADLVLARYDEIISEYASYIAQCSIALVTGVIVFASVAALLAPKIFISRPYSSRRTADSAATAKKILLAVWVIIFAVALVYLFVWSISQTQLWVERLNSDIIGAEASEEWYVLMTEIYIPQDKRNIALSVCSLIFAVSCTPAIVLFIPKIRAAFLPRKKAESV